MTDHASSPAPAPAPPDPFGPAPTVVDLPPAPVGGNDNVAAALASSTPSTTPSTTASHPPSHSSPAPSSGGWGASLAGMGAMGGSLVASARGAASAAASSAGKGVGGGGRGAGGRGGGGGGGASESSGGAEEGSSAFLSSFTANLATSVRDLNAGLSANLSAATAASPSAASAASQSIGSVSLHLKNLGQSLGNSVAGRNTLPDRTTASQVLMFRQLLHTRCRPGLRLSRKYEGTDAQRAVLHMPWWERGIEQTRKMVISYDNLVTRLWLSGAILPFERGGCAAEGGDGEGEGNVAGEGSGTKGPIDTLIDERGLPPVPHAYWVDRLGFQQDDPVTDFRSGGVLSLAMLVHIVESCPAVYSRFVPKPNANASECAKDGPDEIIPLEEIVSDDASVLPFGITCINVTDMLAKFLMFSKAVDKMDALLSAKPFWRMCIDPNAMLVLQEVSLDLLCDVCVEIGRERRVRKIVEKNEGGGGGKDGGGGGMSMTREGKVTVFDFSEIMERTERRVGEEVLGAGPQNVEELRAVARRVKSKYLMRVQLKEKHLVNPPSSPLGKQVPPVPSKESVKNATRSAIDGVGGFVGGMLRKPKPRPEEEDGGPSTQVIDFASPSKSGNDGGQVEVGIDGATSASASGAPTSPANPFAPSSQTSPEKAGRDEASGATDELEQLSAELGELSAAVGGDFDLLGGDDLPSAGDDGHHSEELLDAMDEKVDPFAAFAIDEDELFS